jgi:hypothetical protein
MSLFGKILAILNALAAIGFVYMAATDYGKRQQWSYAVHRHDLALEGLPIDDNQLDVDGKPLAKNLNQATLTDMFQSAGGQPVSTQLAEVNEAKRKTLAKIDGEAITVTNPRTNQQLPLDTPDKRRAFVLLPFAQTLIERKQRVSQMEGNNPAAGPEEIDQLFNGVTSRGSAGDKRQGIAELLLGLLESGDGDLFDTTGFKRFVVVVGRKAAAAALDNQASALAHLARETDDDLAAGRTAFAAEHARGVTRVRDIQAAMQKEKETLEVQRNQTAQQQQLVNDRKRQVADLEAANDKARKTTKAMLAEQARLQKGLMDADRKLRDQNSDNQRDEEIIRKLEEQK